MSREYIRIFQELDINEVKKHLLITGDLSGDCAACQALGLDLYHVTACPECGTSFKFITSRRLESHPGERFSLARRYREKRPDLQFIDYTDYQKVLGQKKARDFFG